MTDTEGILMILMQTSGSKTITMPHVPLSPEVTET